jgi:tetratricopeptide (TPR) repeat protein
LDETLPEAHYSLALIKLWGDWDWAGAEREYKRALELNPNFADARIYYAEFLAEQLRFEEALREIKRAEENDPASLQALGRKVTSTIRCASMIGR